MGLKDDGSGAPLGVGDGEPLPDALGRVVGQPHMPDPACKAGILKCGDCLLHRSGLIVEVGVVDINDLGAQTR